MGRLFRVAAVAIGLTLVAGACSGGERPEMGDPVEEERGTLTVRHLDPELTYVARSDTPVDVYADPADAEPRESVRPPSAEAPTAGLAVDGFIVQAPYEAEPDFHEVALADGSTGWVKADDVRVEQVNIVAIGHGTEVDPSGGGGGT
ncbi:MAG: hypothetical protein ABW310_12390, partial [Acidimicrobiales bacterium]